jgi:hypothetical protein
MNSLMLSLLLISSRIYSPGPGMAGNYPPLPADDIYANYQVQIAGESHLVINGHTNVNSFSCGYDGNFYPDTMTVSTITTGGCLRLKNAQLKLKTSLFDCSNKLMNPDFQDLLKADDYPFIIIRVLEIDKNPGQLNAYYVSNNPKNMLILSVEIMIAGEKNIYDLPIEIAGDRNDSFYKGHLDLNIRDFGLTPPRKMLGLVVVDEKVSIGFMVKLSVI